MGGGGLVGGWRGGKGADRERGLMGGGEGVREGVGFWDEEMDLREGYRRWPNRLCLWRWRRGSGRG